MFQKPNKMREYRKLNLSSPYSIILSFLSAGLTILVVWIFLQTGYTLFLVFGLLLIFLIIFVIYYGLKSKIILTDNEIISMTPFKKRNLDFKQIKKIGVYVAELTTVYDLDKEKHNKWILFGQKFIYLTNDPDLEPYFFKKPKNFIDFHYRNDIYELIKRKINAST